jgi:cobalt transport protein ATP-binding subunit
MTAVPIVEIHDLHYTFADGTEALRGVTLQIQQGEKVGIVGPNGAGKSTLLLHLNGLLRGQGAVQVFGIEVSNATLTPIRRRVGLVFQDPDDQLFCPTLFDDVAFAPRNLKLPEDVVSRRVRQALEAVGLAGLEHKSAFHLSVGQKKRAAIATVLSMEADLLVLDEPTSNLDPRGRRELMALLRCITGSQIIATHDLTLVREVCNRVLMLDQGKVVADGAPQGILEDAALLEAHGL